MKYKIQGTYKIELEIFVDEDSDKYKEILGSYRDRIYYNGDVKNLLEHITSEHVICGYDYVEGVGNMTSRDMRKIIKFGEIYIEPNYEIEQVNE